MDTSLHALERAASLLTKRLYYIEKRLDVESDLWPEYIAAVQALTAALAHAAPGTHGRLLTTAQMAARLGIKPKTLLRRKGKGELRPALQAGKLIRWRGTESIS